MRDMKPLSSGSASAAAAAAYEGHGTGGGAVYARTSASFASPSRAMNVPARAAEKPSTAAGRRAASSAACNSREERGSDYEYVWNMSPQMSSSGKQTKMRLRQQQQQQGVSTNVPRSGSDHNRPDLVSKLENVDGSPVERHGSSAARCTCGLDEARRAAATGPVKPRPPAEDNDDEARALEASAAVETESPLPTLLRTGDRLRKASPGGGEENSFLETSSSSSSSFLLHRTTPADVDSAAPRGTRARAAGDAAAASEAPASTGGGLRKVCRHCGHVVTDGGPGTVRFAPGTAAAATVTHETAAAASTAGAAALGTLSKRLTVKEDGKTSKHGINTSTDATITQHKR